MNLLRPIYLVGPMGVGKSTIGVLLAERLDRRFVDTDDEVVQAAGKPIAQIFEQEGEAHFRRLEAEAIARTAGGNAVVALGGGAIVQPGAAEQLGDWGQIIYLSASTETLLARVGDPSSRPLLAGLSEADRREEVERLHQERQPYYKKASIQIDADGRAEQVVERLMALLEQSPVEAESQER